MKCRRTYPGGAEGLVVPGGGFGSCGRRATKFFAFLEARPGSLTLADDGPNSLYATCDEHARDTVAIPYPVRELDRDEAAVLLIMKS